MPGGRSGWSDGIVKRTESPVCDRRAGQESPKDGFTLIELLVVIGIIAILAAILLPALAKAKAQALNTACKNNLRQMGLGLQMYANDNHQTFPPSWQLQGGPPQEEKDWNSVLAAYDKMPPTNATSHCPIYVQRKGAIISRWQLSTVIGSYAINADGVGQGPANATERSLLGIAPATVAGNPPIRESKIIMPSEMFALGDTRQFNVPGGNQNAFINYSMVTGQPGPSQTFSFGEIWLGLFNGYIGADLGGQGVYSNEFAPPHSQGYNVLNVDGHVATVSRRNMYYPPVAAPHWNNDNQPHQELWAPAGQWVVQK
jgi:prepilin-type N-terminal cleavage/methylation domain-containing protein/prepilin-type processing-associated H-X9-DG protein